MNDLVVVVSYGRGGGKEKEGKGEEKKKKHLKNDNKQWLKRFDRIKVLLPVGMT